MIGETLLLTIETVLHPSSSDRFARMINSYITDKFSICFIATNCFTCQEDWNTCVLQDSVRALSYNMASENKALRQEIGRQERLAVSITDQMHAEAQVFLQGQKY